jgi:RNA polymerase sigma factor (sigma-70 family)
VFGKPSDKELIEGIRSQDEKVLRYLYDHYFQTVKNHVLKNSGSADDASDVFQDTIILIYTQITNNSLSLTSDLKGYFYGVARNIWNSSLRINRRHSDLDMDIVEEEENDLLSNPMLQKILFRAFKKLKPDNQEVLRLFYQGVSCNEIAERMNLKNESYAKRKKYLAKEALMEIIKSDPEYKEYQRFLK